MPAPLTHAASAAGHMLPVVVFLLAILAVSAGCADRGLFDSIGSRLRVGSGRRFLTLVFLTAVAVTAVLSLDATVVLLTPVVIAAARASRLDPTPGGLASVRLANSSSLILPVSNLTTLLAMQQLALGLGTFVLVMFPVWLVAIAIEYAGQRLLFRTHLSATADAPNRPGPPHQPIPVWPAVVVTAMLIGIGVLPVFGVGADWSAAICAGVAAILVWGRSSLGALHPGFAIGVIALAVLVDFLGRVGLDSLLRQVLPHGTDLLALLAIAAIATVLSNLVNNLPATLLLVPLLAPLGVESVLAGLIGLNVGSTLTWTGSLANLLWRRTMIGIGEKPSSALFHRASLRITPLAVIGCTVTLWTWSQIVL